MTEIRTYTIDIDKARRDGRKGGKKTAKRGKAYFSRLGKKSAKARKLKVKCKCGK